MTPDDDLPVPSKPAAYEGLLTQFAQQYLQDRRSDRRWRGFYRLLWVGLAVAVGWMWLSQGRHMNAPSTPHTALVEVRGEIAADTEASAELMLSALKSAFEDDGAQAVVLRINSPGGSPVQAGIVGSIGVLMDGFGFVGLMDKLGVERRLLTAGDNKGMLDPYSPQNAKQRAFAQAMIDQIHQQFITVVREGRGTRLKETPEMFSGLFWNGEEAIKLGLADHYGTLDFVAREVIKAEDVIDYTPHDNVAERLAKRFGASIGAGAVKALRALPAIH